MADPVLHLGGSLTRFTWEWRKGATNSWTLTVSSDASIQAGTAATISGAVVLEMETPEGLPNQTLAGTVTPGQVVWTIAPDDPITPPQGFCSASILNLVPDADGTPIPTLWARGLVYTV